MKRKTQVIIIFLLSLFVISIRSTAVVAQQDLEWKVKVGDSKIYEMKKYFDDTDEDGDGNKNTYNYTVIDEDGNEVNLTMKKGTTIKLEITKLNDVATYKSTYNGDVTTNGTEGLGIYVRKTVNNKTYWVEYVKTMSVGDGEASVDGNLLVFESEYEDMGITYESVMKTDWKTGWMTYLSSKRTNEPDTIYEVEIAVKTAGGVPGFETVPILLGIFVITLVVTRKQPN